MRDRRSGALAALALVGLWGCSAEDDGPNGTPTPPSPTMMGGSGGFAGNTLPPGAGIGAGGGAAIGGGAGNATAGSAGGVGGGAAGAAGMAGMAGTAGGASPGDLSNVMLEAIGANGTVGLDWTRVTGATGYRLYWSTTPGVTPMNGQMIEVAEPSFVHRGLPNGTAHHYVVVALSGATSGAPSAEAMATPHGEWVLEQLGSGDFDDVVTGGRVPRVPIAKRMHILLLPEGYTSADLAIFHSDANHRSGGTGEMGMMATNDVDRWVNEIFALDPYARLKEAFVVWYLPRASAARVGMGDTAFDVVTSGGGVTQVTATAAPLWDAIDGSGEDAFPYPLVAGQPQNMVAAFMVFDSQRMRAGFSGITTFGLRHPTMMNLSIPAAFGLGHPHEFTHAFGRLSDEYMETMNNAPMRTSDTSNVVASNQCDMLPWAHLLAGRGINETEGLVGAFGSPELGYHSEFKCLMNGTHDNGSFWCAEGDELYTTLTLRPQRFCNFCREVIAFRVFERTGVLTGAAAFDSWKSMYRTPFWDRFEFAVPEAVPQTVQCARNGPEEPVYEACVP
jgi:hypothetical protein